MFVVTVRVDAIRPEERASGSLIIEEKQGDFWKRVEVLSLISGTPEAERRLVLPDNRRVVFEGSGATCVVFDREQNAAVPVSRSDEAIEQQITRQHLLQAAADDEAEHRQLQVLHAAACRLKKKGGTSVGND